MVTEQMFVPNSGIEFERAVVDTLVKLKINAHRVGKNDGGVDIIAKPELGKMQWIFYIQCKYYNKPVDKKPIQEVYAARDFYKEEHAFPVVITNNSMTIEARRYAKALGVEIIARDGWEELLEVRKTHIIKDPNVHHGLFGLMLAQVARSSDYLKQVIDKSEEKKRADGTGKNEETMVVKLRIQSLLDDAEEYALESGRLSSQASKMHQKAIALQREALIENLSYI